MQAAADRPQHRALLWLRITAALFAAVLIAALVPLALWVVRWSPSYRRFISQPLPDGSRYTFLYPAHLQDVSEGPGGSPNVSRSATAYNPGPDVPGAWYRLRRMLGLRVPASRESVTVVVIPLKKAPARDSRRGRRHTGAELRHNEYLVDARTRTQFNLYHSCPAYAAAQFEAHNPVIARSFQVLPPGAPPPP